MIPSCFDTGVVFLRIFDDSLAKLVWFPSEPVGKISNMQELWIVCGVASAAVACNYKFAAGVLSRRHLSRNLYLWDFVSSFLKNILLVSTILYKSPLLAVFPSKFPIEHSSLDMSTCEQCILCNSLLVSTFFQKPPLASTTVLCNSLLVRVDRESYFCVTSKNAKCNLHFFLKKRSPPPWKWNWRGETFEISFVNFIFGCGSPMSPWVQTCFNRL